jgi:glycosidase
VWYKRGDAYYYAIFWEGMPDLNYRNAQVTAAMYDVTRFWLEEMGADGFRMDAIRHLIEDGRVQENTPETHAWLEDWYDYYKQIDPYALSVGEVWTRSEDVVPYVGDELDICFEFDLASAILSDVKGGSSGVVDSVAQKAERLYPPGQYATFLTNHDHERAMTQLGEKEAKARVAAAIYLTLPGVPFVYYGEEIGMTGRKPDENLRTPMQWSGEAGAGFTEGIPWYRINADYEMRNVEAQLIDSGSLLSHYRELIRLRSAYQALRDGALVPLLSGDRHIYAYIRHGAEEDLLVVHNLGEEAFSDYALSLRASGLSAGTYRTYDLLSETWGEELEVDDRGGFEGYVPLPSLAPTESHVLLLWQ